jgi:ArsR family transcriptional regulator
VVRSYFAERDSLEPVSREELVERSRAGTVTILDVRPEDEFALGHLPGALNIPLRALEARLGEMDPKKEIVAYCRDPYCVLSYEAVAKLRARGFRLASKMDFLNGALPACRWSPVTRERCPSADLAISTDAHAEAFHRLQACQ